MRCTWPSRPSWLRRASLAEGLAGREVVLHWNNGSAMKGATMLATLEKLGIVRLFSRPRVSNDNAYAESLFRTCKYRPNYPSKPFDRVEAARDWTSKFVQWYNHQHKHSVMMAWTQRSCLSVKKFMRPRRGGVRNAGQVLRGTGNCKTRFG
jgi:putative transposase